MNIDKIISFDIQSEFGFFKKPDVNDKYFTFNIIPKPTLLGIFGAIIGLGGYSQMTKEDIYPEFYRELLDLQIGITPYGNKGIYQKRNIKYNNTVGYANKDGGTLNIEEQTLINPKYKIYVALNLSNKSHKKIDEYLTSKIVQYEYIPYMGKNEFKLDIKNIQVFEENFSFEFNESFAINTIFINNRKEALKLNETLRDPFDVSMSETYFYYYERLPILFDELGQYQYENFSYTNAKFSKDTKFIQDLKLVKIKDIVICLY